MDTAEEQPRPRGFRHNSGDSSSNDDAVLVLSYDGDMVVMPAGPAAGPCRQESVVTAGATPGGEGVNAAASVAGHGAGPATGSGDLPWEQTTTTALGLPGLIKSEVKEEEEEEEENEEDEVGDRAATTTVGAGDGQEGLSITEADLPPGVYDNRVGGSYRCKFCCHKVRTRWQLFLHIERHIKKKTLQKCRHCGFITSLTRILQEHEWKHTNTKPYQCRLCPYKSGVYTDFVCHQDKHNVDKPYACHVCSFRTRWRKGLGKHMETHAEVRPKPHACPHCNLAFKYKSDLRTHLFRRHTDIKPIECDQCSFRCKSNFELRSHKAKHGDSRPYSCTYPGCGRSFKTKSDCTKHTWKHRDDTTYSCHICGKGFKYKMGLRKHAVTHSDERQFECHHCLKKFKTLSALQKHIMIHLDIKPYRCDVCFKTFSSRGNLLTHRQVHEGDRPFKCPMCVYGGRELDHLLVHIGGEHLNDFTYVCSVCRKPFSKSFRLQTHLKTCHKREMGDTELELVYDPMYLDLNFQPEVLDISALKQLASENLEEAPLVGSLHQSAEDGGGQSRMGDTGTNAVAAMAAGSSDLGDYGGCAEGDLNLSVSAALLAPPPVVQICQYGGLKFCMARRGSGFKFNHQKKGKKSKSWFMNPEFMSAEDAERHQLYLQKVQGVSPVRKRKPRRGSSKWSGRNEDKNEVPTSSIKQGNNSGRDHSRQQKVVRETTKRGRKGKKTWQHIESDSDSDDKAPYSFTQYGTVSRRDRIERASASAAAAAVTAVFDVEETSENEKEDNQTVHKRGSLHIKTESSSAELTPQPDLNVAESFVSAGSVSDLSAECLSEDIDLCARKQLSSSSSRSAENKKMFPPKSKRVVHTTGSKSFNKTTHLKQKKVTKQMSGFKATKDIEMQQSLASPNTVPASRTVNSPEMCQVCTTYEGRIKKEQTGTEEKTLHSKAHLPGLDSESLQASLLRDKISISFSKQTCSGPARFCRCVLADGNILERERCVHVVLVDICAESGSLEYLQTNFLNVQSMDFGSHQPLTKQKLTGSEKRKMKKRLASNSTRALAFRKRRMRGHKIALIAKKLSRIHFRSKTQNGVGACLIAAACDAGCFPSSHRKTNEQTSSKRKGKFPKRIIQASTKSDYNEQIIEGSGDVPQSSSVTIVKTKTVGSVASLQLPGMDPTSPASLTDVLEDRDSSGEHLPDTSKWSEKDGTSEFSAQRKDNQKYELHAHEVCPTPKSLTSQKTPKAGRSPKVRSLEKHQTFDSATSDETETNFRICAEDSDVGNTSSFGSPSLEYSPNNRRKSDRPHKIRPPITHPHSQIVLDRLKQTLDNKSGRKVPGISRFGILPKPDKTTKRTPNTPTKTTTGNPKTPPKNTSDTHLESVELSFTHAVLPAGDRSDSLIDGEAGSISLQDDDEAHLSVNSRLDSPVSRKMNTPLTDITESAFSGKDTVSATITVNSSTKDNAKHTEVCETKTMFTDKAQSASTCKAVPPVDYKVPATERTKHRVAEKVSPALDANGASLVSDIEKSPVAANAKNAVDDKTKPQCGCKGNAQPADKTICAVTRSGGKDKPKVTDFQHPVITSSPPDSKVTSPAGCKMNSSAVVSVKPVVSGKAAASPGDQAKPQSDETKPPICDKIASAEKAETSVDNLKSPVTQKVKSLIADKTKPSFVGKTQSPAGGKAKSAVVNNKYQVVEEPTAVDKPVPQADNKSEPPKPNKTSPAVLDEISCIVDKPVPSVASKVDSTVADKVQTPVGGKGKSVATDNLGSKRKSLVSGKTGPLHRSKTRPFALIKGGCVASSKTQSKGIGKVGSVVSGKTKPLTYGRDSSVFSSMEPQLEEHQAVTAETGNISKSPTIIKKGSTSKSSDIEIQTLVSSASEEKLQHKQSEGQKSGSVFDSTHPRTESVVTQRKPAEGDSAEPYTYEERRLGLPAELHMKVCRTKTCPSTMAPERQISGELKELRVILSPLHMPVGMASVSAVAFLSSGSASAGQLAKGTDRKDGDMAETSISSSGTPENNQENVGTKKKQSKSSRLIIDQVIKNLIQSASPSKSSAAVKDLTQCTSQSESNAAHSASESVLEGSSKAGISLKMPLLFSLLSQKTPGHLQNRNLDPPKERGSERLVPDGQSVSNDTGTYDKTELCVCAAARVQVFEQNNASVLSEEASIQDKPEVFVSAAATVQVSKQNTESSVLITKSAKADVFTSASGSLAPVLPTKRKVGRPPKPKSTAGRTTSMKPTDIGAAAVPVHVAKKRPGRPPKLRPTGAMVPIYTSSTQNHNIDHPVQNVSSTSEDNKDTLGSDGTDVVYIPKKKMGRPPKLKPAFPTVTENTKSTATTVLSNSFSESENNEITGSTDACSGKMGDTNAAGAPVPVLKKRLGRPPKLKTIVRAVPVDPCIVQKQKLVTNNTSTESDRCPAPRSMELDKTDVLTPKRKVGRPPKLKPVLPGIRAEAKSFISASSPLSDCSELKKSHTAGTTDSRILEDTASVATATVAKRRLGRSPMLKSTDTDSVQKQNIDSAILNSTVSEVEKSKSSHTLQSNSTDAVFIPKKKRGRPPKTKSASPFATIDASNIVPQVAEAPVEMRKQVPAKKVGRPRKRKFDVNPTLGDTKRKQPKRLGRPPKSRPLTSESSVLEVLMGPSLEDSCVNKSSRLAQSTNGNPGMEKHLSKVADVHPFTKEGDKSNVEGTLIKSLKQDRHKPKKGPTQEKMKQMSVIRKTVKTGNRKRKHNSAFKIVKPSKSATNFKREKSAAQLPQRKKRYLYVELDLGLSPDHHSAAKKRMGRPPGPKIIMDRSQANLCFSSFSPPAAAHEIFGDSLQMDEGDLLPPVLEPELDESIPLKDKVNPATVRAGRKRKRRLKKSAQSPNQQNSDSRLAPPVLQPEMIDTQPDTGTSIGMAAERGDGSDVEFVCADYSSVDLTEQRLPLDHALEAVSYSEDKADEFAAVAEESTEEVEKNEVFLQSTFDQGNANLVKERESSLLKTDVDILGDHVETCIVRNVNEVADSSHSCKEKDTSMVRNHGDADVMRGVHLMRKSSHAEVGRNTHADTDTDSMTEGEALLKKDDSSPCTDTVLLQVSVTGESEVETEQQLGAKNENNTACNMVTTTEKSMLLSNLSQDVPFLAKGQNVTSDEPDNAPQVPQSQQNDADPTTKHGKALRTELTSVKLMPSSEHNNSHSDPPAGHDEGSVSNQQDALEEDHQQVDILAMDSGLSSISSTEMNESDLHQQDRDLSPFCHQLQGDFVDGQRSPNLTVSGSDLLLPESGDKRSHGSCGGVAKNADRNDGGKSRIWVAVSPQMTGVLPDSSISSFDTVTVGIPRVDKANLVLPETMEESVDCMAPIKTDMSGHQVRGETVDELEIETDSACGGPEKISDMTRIMMDENLTFSSGSSETGIGVPFMVSIVGDIEGEGKKVAVEEAKNGIPICEQSQNTLLLDVVENFNGEEENVIPETSFCAKQVGFMPAEHDVPKDRNLCKSGTSEYAIVTEDLSDDEDEQQAAVLAQTGKPLYRCRPQLKADKQISAVQNVTSGCQIYMNTCTTSQDLSDSALVQVMMDHLPEVLDGHSLAEHSFIKPDSHDASFSMRHNVPANTTLKNNGTVNSEVPSTNFTWMKDEHRPAAEGSLLMHSASVSAARSEDASQDRPILINIQAPSVNVYSNILHAPLDTPIHSHASAFDPNSVLNFTRSCAVTTDSEAIRTALNLESDSTQEFFAGSDDDLPRGNHFAIMKGPCIQSSSSGLGFQNTFTAPLTGVLPSVVQNSFRCSSAPPPYSQTPRQLGASSNMCLDSASVVWQACQQMLTDSSHPFSKSSNVLSGPGIGPPPPYTESPVISSNEACFQVPQMDLGSEIVRNADMIPSNFASAQLPRMCQGSANASVTHNSLLSEGLSVSNDSFSAAVRPLFHVDSRDRFDSREDSVSLSCPNESLGSFDEQYADVSVPLCLEPDDDCVASVNGTFPNMHSSSSSLQ